MCLVLEIKNIASFIKMSFYWKLFCGTMRYHYTETCPCKNTYNVVQNVFTQISQCRKWIFMVVLLLANKINILVAFFFWCKVMLVHGLSCGTSEMCEFFALFNLACWVCFQGAMSALGHVVFIWLCFKKRNEM